MEPNGSARRRDPRPSAVEPLAVTARQFTADQAANLPLETAAMAPLPRGLDSRSSTDAAKRLRNAAPRLERGSRLRRTRRSATLRCPNSRAKEHRAAPPGRPYVVGLFRRGAGHTRERAASPGTSTRAVRPLGRAAQLLCGPMVGSRGSPASARAGEYYRDGWPAPPGSGVHCPAPPLPRCFVRGRRGSLHGGRGRAPLCALSARALWPQWCAP